MSPGKSYTNVATFLGILFLAGLFFFIIKEAGQQILATNSSALDTASMAYILELDGIDVSLYYTNQSQFESDAGFYDVPNSSGNPRTFALEFLYAKQEATGPAEVIKNVWNTPSIVMFSILKLNRSTWGWVAQIINFLFYILVTLAIIYLVLRVIT